MNIILVLLFLSFETVENVLVGYQGSTLTDTLPNAASITYCYPSDLFDLTTRTEFSQVGYRCATNVFDDEAKFRLGVYYKSGSDYHFVVGTEQIKMRGCDDFTEQVEYMTPIWLDARSDYMFCFQVDRPLIFHYRTSCSTPETMIAPYSGGFKSVSTSFDGPAVSSNCWHFFFTSDNMIHCPAGEGITGRYCGPCPTGTFANATYQCERCPAGTLQPNTGASSSIECIACGPGKYSVAGSESCSLCYPGTYLASHDKCQNCEIGSYATMEGSTSCTVCPDGYYTSATGSTACQLCTAGYSCINGLISVCPTGTYSNVGQDQCSDCACSGNGVCHADENDCVCFSGFSGRDCSITTETQIADTSSTPTADTSSTQTTDTSSTQTTPMITGGEIAASLGGYFVVVIIIGVLILVLLVINLVAVGVSMFIALKNKNERSDSTKDVEMKNTNSESKEDSEEETKE